MKERVPDACKGEIPYYSFLYAEAGDALRVYLREREEQYGERGADYPLFHSDWNRWNRDERSRMRARTSLFRNYERAPHAYFLPANLSTFA